MSNINDILRNGNNSDSNLINIANNTPENINPKNSNETGYTNGKQKDMNILLVDDYRYTRMIMFKLLNEHQFQEVTMAKNGKEALELAEKNHYDLILMDTSMPVMDGFEATRKIRELPNYKTAPIIALVSFVMRKNIEKCLKAGATDYILTPIEPNEVIDKVKLYTNQHRK